MIDEPVNWFQGCEAGGGGLVDGLSQLAVIPVHNRSERLRVTYL